MFLIPQNKGLYFFWLGTNVGQSFEPITMQFFAIGSEFYQLPFYPLTFFDYCLGTSKNSYELAPGCQKNTGHQKHAILNEFFMSLGKNRKK